MNPTILCLLQKVLGNVYMESMLVSIKTGMCQIWHESKSKNLNSRKEPWWVGEKYCEGSGFFCCGGQSNSCKGTFVVDLPIATKDITAVVLTFLYFGI